MKAQFFFASTIIAGLLLFGCSDERTTKPSLNTGFIAGRVTVEGVGASSSYGIIISVTPYVMLNNGSPKPDQSLIQSSISEDGDYRIEIVPGSYKVSFTSSGGYSGMSAYRYPIEVAAGQTTTLNVEMRERGVVNLLALDYDAQVYLTFEGAYNAVRLWCYRSPSGLDQYELIYDTSNNNRYQIDLPPTVGSYKYKIVAINSNGETPPSNEATVLFSGIPLPPSYFTAQDHINHVSLSWQRNSDGKSYDIYRSLNGDDWTLIKTSTSTIYDDSLQNYALYYYRLKTLSQYNLESQPTQNVSVNYDGRPDAPTNLGAQDAGNEIKLYWNNSLPGTLYKLYRALGENGNYEYIATVNVNYFVDRPIELGTYHYQVTGLIAGGFESDRSIPVSIYFDGHFDPPTAVGTRLQGFRVYINWNSVPNARYYGIYRSADNGEHYQRIEMSNESQWDVPPAIGTYLYAVTTITDDGMVESEKSLPAQIYYSGQGTAPDYINVYSYGTYLQLNWNSVEGADYYKIYRSPALDGEYISIVDSLHNTNFTDSPDTAGYYYYKVQAFTQDRLSSALSNAAYIYFTNKPLPPQFYISNMGYCLQLTWNTDTTRSLYIVYRYDTYANDYIPIDSTTGFTLYDYLVAPGNYSYKMRVKQYDIYSDFSEPAWCYFSARLNAPRLYYINDIGLSILFTWYNLDGANKYNIFRGTSRDNLVWVNYIIGDCAIYDTPPSEGWYFYAVTGETEGGLESPMSAIDSIYFTP
jgi:fibronectin type 3 domain-containing protein